MALKFESNKLINDFINYFWGELDIALNAWEVEVKDNLGSNLAWHLRGGKRNKHINAKVDHYIQLEKMVITGFLKANPYVLADSYGTGSLMLDDNPDLARYRANVGRAEGQWNPSRTGKEIVGRPAGPYIDIFGTHRTSSGIYDGDPIEGKVVGENGFKIEPIPPSKAIQIATDRLYKTYLPRAYKNTLRKINFSKYLIEVNK